MPRTHTLGCISWFGSPASVARGMPAPLGMSQHRIVVEQQLPPPFGAVLPRRIRRYDEGSAGYSMQSGQLSYDPIGWNWVFTKKLPIMPKGTGSYVAGGILWNTTPQNGAQQPRLSRLYTPAQLIQMYGTGTASAMANIPIGGI